MRARRQMRRSQCSLDGPVSARQVREEDVACGQKGHFVDTWPSQGKRCSPLIPLGILMGAT